MDLKTEVKKKITEYDINDELIQSFLYLIADNTLNDKSERDAKNESIRSLFREGFELHDPTGTKKIGSKVIQQALWRVMSKIKFLNYTIHGTGEDEAVERMVTEGVATIGDRGGLTSCFRDKGGVFQNAFLFGDGYLMFGRGLNKENPITFRVLKNEDVYADNFCYGVRGVRPANRVVVVFGFDEQDAYNLWPELKEAGVRGRIPGTYHSEDKDENREDSKLLEVAWGFNISAKTHVIFAGAQAYEIERFTGEEYPYVKGNKPYIPVFQFLCQPSDSGFWNYGIGDMVYDLAVITRKLLNMEVGHIEENVYPVTLINAPQNKVDELVEKMAMANKARASGGKPFVAMEFDPAGGSNSVATQTLLTQNLFNEWSAIWDRLYREISRLGINLDDADRGSGYTRGQVIAEEESANAFIKQMQEYNASESQELIECILDGITEYVSVKNKTPLNLMTRIKLTDGASKKIDTNVTMGMLAKTLKEGNWFVRTDSRTGAITSDLKRMIALESQLQITAPGTPEHAELYREIASIRGLEMEPSQPQPSGNEITPPPPAVGEEAVPQAAETQRVLPPKAGSTLGLPV
jgi:hypothetical protein